MKKGAAKKVRDYNVSNNTKYIGYTNVEVVAFNPTREELNKLMGKEDRADDRPLEYLSTDKDGNQRVKYSFSLYSEELDRTFVHSFMITNAPKFTNDGQKQQYINCTSNTSWAATPADLPTWFTQFTSKEGDVLGDKAFRESLTNEGELGDFLRSWLGKWDFYDPQASTLMKPEVVMNPSNPEIKELVGSEYAAPFTILLGVETDENDPTKTYQKVYKAFLPGTFLENYIKKGFNFKNSTWAKGIWDKFEENLNGDYGFKAYFENVPAKEYISKDDPAAPKEQAMTGVKTAADILAKGITNVNPKF